MARRRDGRWQEPVNLGNPVNTAQEEVQPFITKDGQELWFAGTARDGSGDHAIFMTELTSNGKWSTPQTVIKGLVGEPTLTADKQQLFFVHIYKTPVGYNADIMCSYRRTKGQDHNDAKERQ
jgi:hypothetical protein